MKKPTHCVVYRLHKDNSPTVIDCYSEEECDEELSKIISEGYPKAYKATPLEADKALNDYGKKFEPKPLNHQERWWNWASGRK